MGGESFSSRMVTTKIAVSERPEESVASSATESTGVLSRSMYWEDDVRTSPVELLMTKLPVRSKREYETLSSSRSNALTVVTNSSSLFSRTLAAKKLPDGMSNLGALSTASKTIIMKLACATLRGFPESLAVMLSVYISLISRSRGGTLVISPLSESMVNLPSLPLMMLYVRRLLLPESRSIADTWPTKTAVSSFSTTSNVNEGGETNIGSLSFTSVKSTVSILVLAIRRGSNGTPEPVIPSNRSDTVTINTNSLRPSS